SIIIVDPTTGESARFRLPTPVPGEENSHQKGISLFPDESARAVMSAFWKDDQLFIPHLNLRLNVERTEEELRITRDTCRSQHGVLCIGGALVRVLGPTQLTTYHPKEVSPAKRTGPAGGSRNLESPPYLFGVSGKIHATPAPGSIYCYEEGVLSSIRNPAAASPEFRLISRGTQIPIPEQMISISAGFFIRSRNDWWWVECSNKKTGTVAQFNIGDISTEIKPVALGNRLICASADGSHLILVLKDAGMVQVQRIKVSQKVAALAYDCKRSLIFALTGAGQLNVWHFQNNRFSPINVDLSGQVDRPDRVKRVLAGSQCLVIVGHRSLALVDTTNPAKPRLVKTDPIKSFSNSPPAVVLGPIFFTWNEHNTGEGLFALDMHSAREHHKWSKVARLDSSFEPSGVKGQDSFLMLTGRKRTNREPIRPLLLATDAGYRKEHKNASASLCARNAGLLRQANVAKDANDDAKVRELMNTFLECKIPRAMPISFHDWNVLHKAPREERAQFLTANFLGDHVGVHLNSHATHGPEAAFKVIVHAASTEGLPVFSRDNWIEMLGKVRAPDTENILWHVAASPDDNLASKSLTALVEDGNEHAKRLLIDRYPNASGMALVHMTHGLIEAEIPQARRLIWTRWKKLGLVKDDEHLRIYLQMADAIRRMHMPSFHDLALPFLEHEDPEVIKQGLRIAGRLQDNTAQNTLRKLTHHKLPMVKGEAALALIEIGKIPAVKPLELALEKRDLDFTERLLETFRDREFRDEEPFVDIVRKICQDPTWDDKNDLIRYHAVRTLAQIGSEKDLQLLENLQEDKNPNVRRMARYAQRRLERELRRDKRIAAAKGNITAFRPSEKEFQEMIAGLENAKWKKHDPHQNKQDWYGVEGGVALVDKEKRQVRYFTTLFGLEDLTVNDIGFGVGKVWLATNHGLMAWDRHLSFWTRYTPVLEYVDSPVLHVDIEKEGAVTIEIQPKRQQRLMFRFEPKKGEWTELQK
ncbi:MAG: HEAT repeat domain-containing protein, partial [Planctomycetes bacterium]|nr:HEAT repeat domain-containing protein [Planctomycetota bacterium]